LGVSAYRVDGVGFPGVFNIERDPRELWNVLGVEDRVDFRQPFLTFI